MGTGQQHQQNAQLHISKKFSSSHIPIWHGTLHMKWIQIVLNISGKQSAKNYGLSLDMCWYWNTVLQLQ